MPGKTIFLYADRKISASTGAKVRFPHYGENWRAQRVGKTNLTEKTLDKPIAPELTFTAKLRGEQPHAKDLRERENKMAIAGLRNTAEAVHRLPGQIKLGTVLASLFKKVLFEDSHLREMLVDMSSGKLPAKTLDGMSQELDNILVPAGENLAKTPQLSRHSRCQN